MQRDYAQQARFHRDRAQQFRHHAGSTKNPETRDRYLRLAEHEEALAETMEKRLKRGGEG